MCENNMDNLLKMSSFKDNRVDGVWKTKTIDKLYFQVKDLEFLFSRPHNYSHSIKWPKYPAYYLVGELISLHVT
jgi:hypothetical protein